MIKNVETVPFLICYEIPDLCIPFHHEMDYPARHLCTIVRVSRYSFSVVIFQGKGSWVLSAGSASSALETLFVRGRGFTCDRSPDTVKFCFINQSPHTVEIPIQSSEGSEVRSLTTEQKGFENSTCSFSGGQCSRLL